MRIYDSEERFTLSHSFISHVLLSAKLSTFGNGVVTATLTPHAYGLITSGVGIHVSVLTDPNCWSDPRKIN